MTGFLRAARSITPGLVLTVVLLAPASALAQELPDEGYIAPPPVEYEHESLTLLAPQHDPPATTGGEYVLGAVDAPQPGAAAATEAATPTATATGGTPTGSLPFTGVDTWIVQVLAVAFLLLGFAAYAAAAIWQEFAQQSRFRGRPA